MFGNLGFDAPWWLLLAILVACVAGAYAVSGMGRAGGIAATALNVLAFVFGAALAITLLHDSGWNLGFYAPWWLLLLGLIPVIWIFSYRSLAGLGKFRRLVAIGLCAGLVASVGLTRLLASLLFGVTEHDPATFSMVALLVSAVAFLGVSIPARRAAALDPVEDFVIVRGAAVPADVYRAVARVLLFLVLRHGAYSWSAQSRRILPASPVLT